MIVLDATNKSLNVSFTNVGGSAVVSYWSVDTSNVWTLHSQRTAVLAADTTILAAPSAGEVRVVENIWIETTSPTGSNSAFIRFKEAAASTVLGGFSTIVTGDVITMSRDGLFSLLNAL